MEIRSGDEGVQARGPLLAWYRRLGADPPFGDPLRGHGIGMEGYYWRLSDVTGRRVIIALCGVCRDSDGSWALVALAAHPLRVVAQRVVAPAVADPAGFGARAREAFRGSAGRLCVDLGDEARLEVELRDRVVWPHRAFGALGPAHWIPGLGQYWHPHVLGGVVSGELLTGGQRLSLDGWRVYAEKNWGSAFPRRWWWGQASDFGEADDVCLAFAGGLLGAGVSATGIVVRVGREVVRLAAPSAVVRARVDGRRWVLRGHSPRWAVTVEGVGTGAPYALPVPVPSERRVEPRAAQDLAGTVRLSVRRRGRTVFAGESGLAGLEYGT